MALVHPSPLLELLTKFSKPHPPFTSKIFQVHGTKTYYHYYTFFLEYCQDLFSLYKEQFCSATIDIGQKTEKVLRDRPKSARTKLPHKIQVKEGLSLE